jgi:hypothetical protein
MQILSITWLRAKAENLGILCSEAEDPMQILSIAWLRAKAENVGISMLRSADPMQILSIEWLMAVMKEGKFGSWERPWMIVASGGSSWARCYRHWLYG